VTKLETLAVWVEALRLVAPLRLSASDPLVADLVSEAAIYVDDGAQPADAVHVLKRQGLPPPARLRVARPLRD
jgi:hypothetical protein